MPHGQKQPRHHRPAPRNVDPLFARVAHHQRAQRKGKRHREAHIAEVEHRRMHHHLRILQQRIQPGAIRRDRPRRDRKRRRAKAQQQQEENLDGRQDRRGERASAARRPGGASAARSHRRSATRPTAAASLPGRSTARQTCTPDSAQCCECARMYSTEKSLVNAAQTSAKAAQHRTIKLAMPARRAVSPRRFQMASGRRVMRRPLGDAPHSARPPTDKL